MIKPARFYVGVTDTKWFRFLRDEPLLDEVNFWSPGGRKINAERGMPFLFKLKSPENVIGGGAFVSFVERMPIRDAWEFFGRENGAPTLEDLRLRIQANRKAPTGVNKKNRLLRPVAAVLFQHSRRAAPGLGGIDSGWQILLLDGKRSSAEFGATSRLRWRPASLGLR